MVLLGHSFGGAVGLASIIDTCIPTLCLTGYNHPEALVGGVFYGTSFATDPRFPGQIPPLPNDSLAVALIAGSLDSVAEFDHIPATYEQIQDPPNALITVFGANHYGITNENNPFRDPSAPTLEQAVATETIARWSALFLQGSAFGDPEALEYVFKTGDPGDMNVTVQSDPKQVPEPGILLGMMIIGLFGVRLSTKVSI